ncbi:MAG: LysR substrate-binding domain-containing protein [Polaromonas sp.]
MKHLPSVRQLRAFAAVYQTGNISAAAQMLALTQPAVTVLLRELEAKLGVRLFERTTRSLRRTDAATEAMAYAQRVLDDLNDMRLCMDDLAGSRRGQLRLSATSTVAQTLMPSLIRRFQNRHPEIRVIVDDCAPNEFVERITSERVHLGIGTLEAPIFGLVEREFLKDWLAAVAPAGLLMDSNKPITWKQLAALPVVVVKSGYGVRYSIDHAAAEAGVVLKVAHEVSLLSTALAMASAGLGVAIVPGSLVSQTPYSGLVTRRLVRPLVARNTAVIYRKDHALTPAARAFADMLHSA